MNKLLDFSSNAWINVLKVLIVLLGLPIVGLGSMFMLEVLTFAETLGSPLVPFKPIFLALLGLTMLLFLLIVYRGIALLSRIQKGDIYSSHSVRHLHLASVYSGLISGIYVLFLPVFYSVADRDDAPGFMVLGLFFIVLSLAFALFLFVIKRLLVQAISLKEENDLVV